MNKNRLKKIYTGLIGAILLLLALFFLVNWDKKDNINPINQLRIDSNNIYQKIQNNWSEDEADYSFISENPDDLEIRTTIIDIEQRNLFTNSSTYNIDDNEILKEALYMDNAYIYSSPNTYKIAQPIFNENDVVGFAIFEKTYQHKENIISYEYLVAGVILVLVMILIILLGFLIFRSQTSELEEIRNALNNIAKGNYRNLELTKNSEYYNLYHTYNMMVNEIKYVMEKKDYNEHQRKVFINKISHELKTPIATINAYAEGLKNNLAGDERKRQEYIDIIYIKIRQLTELIDDFFAYAQEDAHQFKYNFKEYYANDVVDEIFNSINEQKDKRTKCSNLLTKCIVNVDKIRLEQVILNLYNNAKKHTKENEEIKISAYREDNSIVVEVRDTGEGIPLSELPYIFDSYYQGSKSKDTDYQGAGLGLSICKSIIDAHKGRIKVKSQAGEGTTMYIYIPMV